MHQIDWRCRFGGGTEVSVLGFVGIFVISLFVFSYRGPSSSILVPKRAPPSSASASVSASASRPNSRI